MRYLLLILFVSGCASQVGQRQAEEQNRQDNERLAYRNRLMNSCESIGYKKDTDPWRQCIMQLHSQNQASDTALGAALLQGLSSQPRMVPSCRGLPPGTAGYSRARGDCY